MTLLRRYKQRETLRIAYGDIVQKQRLEMVSEQISFLADAICEAALRTAWRRLAEKGGHPRRPDGRPARFVVLGLGKLGGVELNYSSDIDLVLVSDGDGKTDRSASGQQSGVLRPLGGPIRQAAQRADRSRRRLSCRSASPAGRSTRGRRSWVSSRPSRYYDLKGRTWERQAFVKARPIAGDMDLGREFLEQLEPWIYRRYLSSADITGIKALKRRIEQRAKREGGDARNIKTGRGGIRDIEFVIQFLQLLNGGDLREIRTTEYAASHRRLGARRLFENGRARSSVRELPVPAQRGAPAADHVRLADAYAARERGRTAAAGHPHGIRGSAPRGRPEEIQDGAEEQDGNESQDPRFPARRGVRRRRRSRTRDRSGPGPRSAAGRHPGDPQSLRFSRRIGRLPESHGFGPGEDLLSIDPPLQALLGRDCPAPAASDCPHAGSRRHAGQSQQGQRFPGGQGRAVGIVQLQPPVAAAVRPAVRVQSLPVRHSHQQSRDDRRADGLVDARQTAHAFLPRNNAGGTMPRSGGHRSHPAQLQELVPPPRGSPRHPRQREHPLDASRAVRHRGSLPERDHAPRIRSAGGPPRCADRQQWVGGGTTLLADHSGHGKAGRTRAELPQ